MAKLLLLEKTLLFFKNSISWENLYFFLTKLLLLAKPLIFLAKPLPFDKTFLFG
jgi:hypothetical protein